LIARLQDGIHACLEDLVTADEPVAMVDFPNYSNVGDSAIWLGQMAYLAARHGKRPSYISGLDDHSHERLDAAMPSGPILITGGGSFGDIWGGHQELRESILERWPGRPVVQLPQSIHYTSPENADRMARAIARHGNFVLLVRDEESKAFAERHFDCRVRLCPDMAFASLPQHRIFPCLPCFVPTRRGPRRTTSTPIRICRWRTGSANRAPPFALPRRSAPSGPLR
jgi:pyruvyl transferase EpsO